MLPPRLLTPRPPLTPRALPRRPHPRQSEDSGVDGESLAEEAYEAPEEEGALTKLHGHHHSKIPIFRVLMNNWLGLLINVMYMAWVSAAFYGMASW